MKTMTSHCLVTIYFRGVFMRMLPSFYLVVLCLCSILLVACSGGNKTNPAVTTPPDSSLRFATQAAQTTIVDEKSILKETQAFITQFSKDLSEGKTEAVLKGMESSARQQIGDSLDLTGSGGKKLAEAISKAKSTQVNPTIVFYESTIDGEAMSFYIIKEAGQWKLGGL
jgi:hypothetical protein